MKIKRKSLQRLKLEDENSTSKNLYIMYSYLYKFLVTCKRLYKSLCRSVGRSVGPLRLCRNCIFRLFLATVRSYTETNDQPTCFESLFTRLFVHLSLHTYVAWTIHAETQPGRIVARSGLFFLFIFFSFLFLFFFLFFFRIPLPSRPSSPLSF